MWQYFKWLVLIILSLIAILFFGQKKESVIETSFFLRIFAPMQNILSSSASGVENFWQNYFKLVNLKEENTILKDEIALKSQEISVLTEYKLANERLNELLNFKVENQQLNLVTAKVVAWNPGPWLKTLTINKGTNDGLKLEQAVINSQGAVGRIVELSSNYAKVLLLNDYASSVSGIVQRSRQLVIVSGQGTEALVINYVNSDSDIRLGDEIISSGFDDNFPAGINLGRISFIEKKEVDTFMEIKVTPTVNYNIVEEVFVVINDTNIFEQMFFFQNILKETEKRK